MEIDQLAIYLEGLEAMRETLGYKQAFSIGSGKNLAVPAAERGRTLSDIHGDVVNFASKTTDDFAFRVRRILVMETADSPFFYGVGVVNLGDRIFHPGGPVFFGAKEATEKASFIGNGLSLQHPKVFKGRRMEVEMRRLHLSGSAVSNCCS